MANIRMYQGEQIPIEMHKVKTVQKISLLPVEERAKKMKEAGYNSFMLHNKDIFLDMLTDSGVNAMSDRAQAAMLTADDAYAGSETFYKMQEKCREIFGFDYLLPAHQGRACENIIATHFIKPGMSCIMNYHFTTFKAHVLRVGGNVIELVSDAGMESKSDLPFKGNFDLDKLRQTIQERGAENIALLRVEAGTNLIGGQPISYENMKAATAIARENGIVTIMDASLLQDNLYFIKTREQGMADKSIPELTKMISSLFDMIYFSARKLGFARGGGILVRDRAMYESIQDLIPMYEGFLTYGGMSVKEMEAIIVGLDETMDMDVISHGPQFIEYMVRRLEENHIPVVTPAGGLGAHIDAREFCSHIPAEEYPAGALTAALYIASGVRGMERGTLSEEREPDGREHIAACELLRLALPRRVFTLSQIDYTVDRVRWLYDNRKLIGGLRFIHEPAALRFFTGVLEPTSDWPQMLVEKFRADFCDSL